MTIERRIEIIEGDAFTLEGLSDGVQMRVDFRESDESITTTTLAEADGVITHTPTPLGTHYAALRSSATESWQTWGTLVVRTLVDEVRERLVTELTDLNKRVSELSAIQFQESDPSGTAVTRVNLIQLRSARARAETRLADYERVRQGRLPVRLS